MCDMTDREIKLANAAPHLLNTCEKCLALCELLKDATIAQEKKSVIIRDISVLLGDAIIGVENPNYIKTNDPEF